MYQRQHKDLGSLIDACDKYLKCELLDDELKEVLEGAKVTFECLDRFVFDWRSELEALPFGLVINGDAQRDAIYTMTEICETLDYYIVGFGETYSDEDREDCGI